MSQRFAVLAKELEGETRRRNTSSLQKAKFAIFPPPLGHCRQTLSIFASFLVVLHSADSCALRSPPSPFPPLVLTLPNVPTYSHHLYIPNSLLTISLSFTCQTLILTPTAARDISGPTHDFLPRAFLPTPSPYLTSKQPHYTHTQYYAPPAKSQTQHSSSACTPP